MTYRIPLLALLLLFTACAAEPGDPTFTAGLAALDGDPVTVQLTVAATYEDRAPLADGGEDITTKPIRGARFEVLADDDVLLAEGVTDATGNGGATFEAIAGEAVRVRVLALTAHRASTVAVRNDDYAIYAVESAPAGAEELMELPVHAAAEAGGGAFNLFDGVAHVVRTLTDRYGPTTGLDVVWTPGVGHGCGSCYLPTANVRRVGGAGGEPDQGDDSVVLHELGHWFEAQLAATTNPGGPHDGSPTDPDLAWSEGFASFFGQAHIGDPVYVDSFESGIWSMDLERMAGNHAWGTEDGTLAGPVSENLVAAVLWDLFDQGAPEPADALAVDLLLLLEPAVYWLGGDAATDTGAGGVDLADYITGWLATGNGRWWSLADVVLARGYPYPFHAPPIPAP